MEDYFHVAAFEKVVERRAWSDFVPRVEANTHLILDLLDEESTKGTFFVLGWVGERLPGLVRQIHSRGHEVGCHGFGHERIYIIGPEKFRADVRRSKSLLEDLAGEKIHGYRAPTFSITEKSIWALDILLEEGFTYDSSIFPIRHDNYGMRLENPFPHEIRRAGGTLREFPMSTVKLRLPTGAVRVPVAGGGYLRLFPLWFIKHAIRRINTRDGQPAVLYFHPWEVDPGQPRINACLKSRLRHYVNLRGTFGKVRELLSTFRFAPMADVLGMRS